MSNEKAKATLDWEAIDETRKNLPRIPDDYEFILVALPDDTEGPAVVIKAGQFAGVIFRFDNLRFADKENEDGSCDLNFSCSVAQSEDYNELEVAAHPEFIKLSGDIMMATLIDSISLEEEKQRLADANRNDNTEVTDIE